MSWLWREISALLQTGPEECHWSLFLVDIGNEDEVAGLSARHLVASEKRQLAGYRFPKRRLEWLAGRLAAKNAITRISSVPLASREITISTGKQGRPLAATSNGEDPHISISHSGQHAVGLAARRPCGVDLQEITPALEKIRQRFVRPEEENILPQLADAPRTALGLLWSAKESLRKSVPLWPLLGFLECAACGIKQHENGVRTITLRPCGHDRALPEQLPLTRVTTMNNMALAINFQDKD